MIMMILLMILVNTEYEGHWQTQPTQLAVKL